MKRTHFNNLIRFSLAAFFLCVIVLAFASCGAAGQKGSGEAAGDPSSEAEQSQDKADDKASAKKIKLKSGRSVKVDSEGHITKKSVLKLKSGTEITAKEVKKTGGAGRYFRIFKIKKKSTVYNRINGRSYRDNPNVALGDLRYIKVLHYGFSGKIKVGEIIVHKDIAEDVKKIFRELYDSKYQIRKMRLVDDYWKKGGTGTDADNASMNDDNTSGFNYRNIAGTSTISKHGYGRAIDVNPFENPWCPNGKLYPNQSSSAEYANRNVRKAHMIFADSDITKIFKKHGFRWLGETSTRDYQHFEK